ncbi:MAG TPA: hypothetical protein VHO69_11460 [Phototrophicaceae bacterium]|nr:hypothetical protein [Phototrophicaceae bacterium]
MSQAQALYRLQEIELRLLRGQKRLNEITSALGDNHTIAEAQTLAQAAQQALTPQQTRARHLELEIQSNVDKIRETDERLYSGRVRNPKELQDMQQEIQSLKKRNQELEDVLLEVMLEVEAAETRLAEAKSNQTHITADWENQNRQLLDEQTQLKSEQEQLLRQRKQALTETDADSLNAYNLLKPRKQNQPVAVLEGDTCSTCGVEQTKTIISETDRGASLAKCLSCGRILVRKPGRG